MANYPNYPQYPYQDPYAPYYTGYLTPQQRLQQLEQQYPQYGQAQPVQMPDAVSQPQQPAAVNVQGFIEVGSEDEAWSHPVDWSGKKQYFINKNDPDVIYVKHFDANVPTTHKDVYRRSPQVTTDEAKTEAADKIAPAIEDLTVRIDELSEVINDLPDYEERFISIEKGIKILKELILSESNLEKSVGDRSRKVSRSGSNSDESSGSGAVGAKHKRSNGPVGKSGGE